MADDLRDRLDPWHMAHALHLAELGRGAVEPNPLVGCVIAHGAEIVGEGWHRRFGGPHAEIEALALAGLRAQGSTAYVSLEPCCHVGKTPPCTQALRAAGVRRVVAACVDPFPQVDGGGLAELEAAGIEVTRGIGQCEALAQNRAYFKRLSQRKPWVIAKWAMTLDGRLASRSGDSRWISSEAARRIVHEIRGRVDAILVGSGTAAADDPLLTARPAGPRRAARIVFDSGATLSSASQLVLTARDVPVLVAVGPTATQFDRERLEKSGCEVWTASGQTHRERLDQLLTELGSREMTNLLVEGGGRLLGALFDADQIDEVQVFVSPRLVGGQTAPGPLGGLGRATIADCVELDDVVQTQVDGDWHIRGIVRRRQPKP